MVYVKDFTFPKDFGFHGSSSTSDGAPHLARGGKVQRKAMGGQADPVAGSAEPTISMPVSTAQNMAKGIAALGARQGAAAAQQQLVRRPLAPHPPAPVGGALSGVPQRAQMAPMGAAATPGTPMPMARGGHMKKGGHLTAAERHALPKDDFALPGGRYPIEDASHARNALARVSQFGDPGEKAKVRAAVHRKFPDIGKK